MHGRRGWTTISPSPPSSCTLRAKLTQWLGSDARSRPRRPNGARATIRSIARASSSSPAVPQGIAEVLAELESGVRADIAALQVALERGNAAALRSAAHRIKGSALTIGAERLAALGRRRRGCARGVDTPQLMSNARALLDELERVLLSARVQRNAPSS